MKLELFPFQSKALSLLRNYTAEALGAYRRTNVPQVISFTAPTGSGKTIILSSLIETIYHGNEFYPEQPEAIFVWLSDSPELNEQSKLKIETKSDKIRIGQCVTIENEDFDQEVLDDGHIYFLNTQKLGKSSNLTKYSNRRQFTIWDTLSNTVNEKSSHLYFIIDEAHRGAKSEDPRTATTIMQKFIKGSPENGMEAMPVVIGMSATNQRFNTLIEGTTSTIHQVVIPVEDVRNSGLLKDRIIITYPEESLANKDMAVLQAAADEWKEKWDHWYQYSVEQHSAHVNPIFLIQVENKDGKSISKTNLDETLNRIEKRTGFKFKFGEVVHAFGDTKSAIEVNGLKVPYKEPSRINDDRNIKIVFFKESLSTGWDAPRAETMMSFKSANDATYIAQLLGRMVRTPKQMRIQVDESLNDVYLFLPHFNRATVDKIVDAFQISEGDTIPAEVEGNELGDESFDTWSVRTPSPQRTPEPEEGQLAWDFENGGKLVEADEDGNTVLLLPESETEEKNRANPEKNFRPTNQGNDDSLEPSVDHKNNDKKDELHKDVTLDLDGDINREEIINFINKSGLLTYNVRTVRINDYLTSLYKLLRLLVQSGLDTSIMNEVTDKIVENIRDYINDLKEKGLYDSLVKDLMEFKLSTRVYDVFGEIIEEDSLGSLFSTTDVDIDRQFRQAEARLKNQGIGQKYGMKYFDKDNQNSYKIDVILYSIDEDCINKLYIFAKETFQKLNDKWRIYIPTISEDFQNQYEQISSNSDRISRHNFKIPETVNVARKEDTKPYDDHLLVNPETGVAHISLNSWEEGVLEEEQAREDYVCWLRNPDRKTWALQIPYEMDNEIKPMYPDLIIIRKDAKLGYVIDILEPHNESLADNVGKAKGLAEYARQNPGVGRIELIRKGKNPSGAPRFKRLDMSRSAVREKVSKINSNDELNRIFDTEGEIGN